MEAEPSAARPSTPLAQPGLSGSVPAQTVPAQTVPAETVPAAAVPGPSPVMALLQDHLPLTLLLDLAWGVCSREVYAAEPADLSWLHRPAVA